MPVLDLAGEPFHVRLDGPEGAPVLVLSNSLSSNLTMWDPQVAEWAKSFRILRYDSRGHGQSAAPDRPYSIAELGRDALAIMDRLGIARAHWCGLSKGGMVGMWVATHAPERIERLVLANTAARMTPPELWNGRIRTVRRHGMGYITEATLERWFTRRFLEEAPAEIARIRTMIETTPAAGYMGCAAAIRDMDQHESIAAISAPTLVIVGEHDPATPPAAGELIASRIAGAKLVRLDAAHLSNLEGPAEFTRAVAEFLKD